MTIDTSENGFLRLLKTVASDHQRYISPYFTQDSIYLRIPSLRALSFFSCITKNLLSHRNRGTATSVSIMATFLGKGTFTAEEMEELGINLPSPSQLASNLSVIKRPTTSAQAPWDVATWRREDLKSLGIRYTVKKHKILPPVEIQATTPVPRSDNLPEGSGHSAPSANSRKKAAQKKRRLARQAAGLTDIAPEERSHTSEPAHAEAGASRPSHGNGGNEIGNVPMAGKVAPPSGARPDLPAQQHAEPKGDAFSDASLRGAQADQRDQADVSKNSKNSDLEFPKVQNTVTTSDSASSNRLGPSEKSQERSDAPPAATEEVQTQQELVEAFTSTSRSKSSDAKAHVDRNEALEAAEADDAEDVTVEEGRSRPSEPQSTLEAKHIPGPALQQDHFDQEIAGNTGMIHEATPSVSQQKQSQPEEVVPASSAQPQTLDDLRSRDPDTQADQADPVEPASDKGFTTVQRKSGKLGKQKRSKLADVQRQEASNRIEAADPPPVQPSDKKVASQPGHSSTEATPNSWADTAVPSNSAKDALKPVSEQQRSSEVTEQVDKTRLPQPTGGTVNKADSPKPASNPWQRSKIMNPPETAPASRKQAWPTPSEQGSYASSSKQPSRPRQYSEVLKPLEVASPSRSVWLKLSEQDRRTSLSKPMERVDGFDEPQIGRQKEHERALCHGCGNKWDVGG